MVNIIWLILLLAGILVAGINGRIEVVTEAAFHAAKTGVEISIEIIGIMTLWLGLLKLAEKSGLVQLLAKFIRPLAILLFPSIPKDSPALGSIIMNLSANVLGLGNAATPFGLKAMSQLQQLNRNKDEASDAMITFLALNTSCITLIPAMVISLRVKEGSANPVEIVGTTIVATACGTVLAMISDHYLRNKYYRNHKR
ncbi:nucleoside recognition domain-containing protein [Candidatus Formimonas warabiya]|uniref:Spore maturation protein n=1 Tax=Formimonas warabiya TaxID=1761012 RepID=A0A3G1KNP6_FORW1|nr:nucleoside recognition domain-containing protein [Candidatus Formimonas warabiya]ATW24094.1 spore maturation protein [Candidatus Formimonas warabiya]